ncbi:hypothetical protein CSUB01_00037 [Colletotrichum sublineola]|uniref:Uncharacterized protein n=1 Tax=Colletotrichum sublineola TaxID=1173701 RepID=A0A066XXD8_COLSU|nr:hypothetical protein CSUB01_00037 [Colletotrichum sublineola]
MDNEGGKEPSARLPTIYLLAHRCRASFFKLSQDLPTTEYHDVEPKITDEAGRFNVWALNIGALQRPQSSSSLDSRLRRSERMKNIVISGLQRLENVLLVQILSPILIQFLTQFLTQSLVKSPIHANQLSSANEIALGNMPNRTTSPATAEEIIKHSVGTVKSTDKRDHDFTTEINELFNNIQSCITYLFTLSTLLRRSHPRGRTSQQGSQSSQSDPRPFITNAKDKFPKLKQSPWLAERIGQRTARQMDYIRYRQNHRAKLSRVDVGLIQDELTERATTKATSFHDTVAASDSIKKPASRSSREESIYTVASSFAQTAIGDTYSGRIIPQLTDMWLDGRQLGYGEPVECPYCRTIQIIKDRYHWKPTFARSRSVQSGRSRLPTNGFNMKLTNTDGNGSESCVMQNRKVMLKACEKPLNHFDTDSCLLCDDWSPSSETDGNSNKFRSHLAKHYQDLACEAIPLAIEGLEINAADNSDDNSAPSDGDEHSTMSEDRNRAHTVLVGRYIAEGKVWRCHRIHSKGRCGCGDASGEYDEWAIADKSGSHTQSRTYLESRLKARLEAVARPRRGLKYEELEEAKARQEAAYYERSKAETEAHLRLGTEWIAKPERILLEMEAEYERMRAKGTDAASDWKWPSLISRPPINNTSPTTLHEAPEQKRDPEGSGKSHFIFLNIVWDMAEARLLVPFLLGRSWGYMENFIKTKLPDLDDLVSRVENGCYDLLAPNGEIIRPSAWTETVMPGWTVTLSVWTDGMIRARDQVYENPEEDILLNQQVLDKAPSSVKPASSAIEDSDEEWDEDNMAELIHRRQKMRMQRMETYGSIGKLTISERSDSDDEDWTPVDPDAVGSSARRLRRQVRNPDLQFQDPPPGGVQTFDHEESMPPDSEETYTKSSSSVRVSMDSHHKSPSIKSHSGSSSSKPSSSKEAGVQIDAWVCVSEPFVR